MGWRATTATLVDNLCIGFCMTMPIARHLLSKPCPRLGWLLTCAALALTACGGGGSDEAPSTLGNVVGAWKGSPGNESSPLAALILPSGAYWAFYDNTTGTGAGFERGTANATGTYFRASAEVYPDDFTASNVSISAEMSNGALNGSRTVGHTSPQNFALLRIPSTDFIAQQVRVSHLIGEWRGELLPGFIDWLQVTADNNGPFYGKHPKSGCDFTAAFVPQSNAYAFDATLTFTGNACSLIGTTATGVAMVYKNGTEQKLMLMAVKDSALSRGWLLSLSQ